MERLTLDIEAQKQIVNFKTLEARIVCSSEIGRVVPRISINFES